VLVAHQWTQGSQALLIRVVNPPRSRIRSTSTIQPNAVQSAKEDFMFPDFKSYYAALANRPSWWADIDALNRSFKIQADLLVDGYNAYTNSRLDVLKTKSRRAFLFSILPIAASPAGPTIANFSDNLGGGVDWVAALSQRQAAIKAFQD
jgi:hypothetical protein